MRYKLSLCLIFGLTMLIFAFFINFISKSVINRGVNDIEIYDVKSDINEIYSLLAASTIRLKNHVFDWAVFDPVYYYVEGKYSEFIERDFNISKIDKMHFSGIAIYDINGKCLAHVDGSKLAFGESWIESEMLIFNKVVNSILYTDTENCEGFINVDGIPMIVAIHKIFDSIKEKKSNGYLVMAIALDNKFREESQSISGLQFSILPLNVYNRSSAIQLEENLKVFKTSNEIRVYSIIKDIFGIPAFCLEIKRPRTIAAFGKEISNKNFLLMLILCVLVLSGGFITIYFAQRAVLRDEINYRAKHDKLTGLPNAAFLQDRFNDIVKFALQKEYRVSLLFINIDNFKIINNCYGYVYGDRILCKIANRLQELVSENDVIRSNSDNFQVVIPDKNYRDVINKANEILELFKDPFIIDINRLYITASIGIAFYDTACKGCLELVHNAELAMFDAKRRGGNTLSIFDTTMGNAALERKNLELALIEAVEQNTFTVFYQPKVNIVKKDVVGLEALARWQTKDGDWVSPAVFISIAEEIGLISHIDMLILRRACRQVLEWRKKDHISVPIAVNMSVRSIMSEGFAERVISILNEEGTPPELIEVEITESCFMFDIKAAYNVIYQLHKAGIRIALDDFGTGYSSLQYLSSMPISFLKIDKKFIDDIFSGIETAQSLVKGIISLARSLRMCTISEGVESKKQLAFLSRNGAHVIQGYLFSKPLNVVDCEKFLRNRKARIAEILDVD